MMKQISRVILLLVLAISITGCHVNALSALRANETVIKDEQYNYKILIVYNDFSDAISNLAKMISDKILSDTYNINSNQELNIADYDLIIIGDTVIDDQLSSVMSTFLEKYDFQNKDVSLFWVGASNNAEFERLFASKINHGVILPGIGFNGDEIAEMELISQFVDGWITTIYSDNKNNY